MVKRNYLKKIPESGVVAARLNDVLQEAAQLKILLKLARDIEEASPIDPCEIGEPASPLGIERQMLEAGGKALASPFNEAGKMLEPAMSKVSKAMELSKAIPNDEGANS